MVLVWVDDSTETGAASRRRHSALWLGRSSRQAAHGPVIPECQAACGQTRQYSAVAARASLRLGGFGGVPVLACRVGGGGRPFACASVRLRFRPGAASDRATGRVEETHLDRGAVPWTVPTPVPAAACTSARRRAVASRPRSARRGQRRGTQGYGSGTLSQESLESFHTSTISRPSFCGRVAANRLDRLRDPGIQRWSPIDVESRPATEHQDRFG